MPPRRSDSGARSVANPRWRRTRGGSRGTLGGRPEPRGDVIAGQTLPARDQERRRDQPDGAEAHHVRDQRKEEARNQGHAREGDGRAASARAIERTLARRFVPALRTAACGDGTHVVPARGTSASAPGRVEAQADDQQPRRQAHADHGSRGDEGVQPGVTLPRSDHDDHAGVRADPAAQAPEGERRHAQERPPQAALWRRRDGRHGDPRGVVPESPPARPMLEAVRDDPGNECPAPGAQDQAENESESHHLPGVYRARRKKLQWREATGTLGGASARRSCARPTFLSLTPQPGPRIGTSSPGRWLFGESQHRH